MQIVFSEKDVARILKEEARKLGMNPGEVDFVSSYSTFQTATVSEFVPEVADDYNKAGAV